FAISNANILSAMAESPDLVRLFTRFIATSDSQMSHTLLAATTFTITQRLARWLLMYHDRVDGDEFPITHEVLSIMLGVRRAGVTGQMHVLEGHRAIKASRGRVLVRDRDILIRIAAGCYGLPEEEYERLIPAV
ncbi:MAG: Crp/Fnr family transcriptional regulator, partial [Oxalobacteraceae bacterium]